MFYVEDNNFLKNEHISFIESILYSKVFPTMPFYYQSNSTENDKLSFLCNVIKDRPEYTQPNQKINSPYYGTFRDILITFCTKNKINFREILRIAVNITYNNAAQTCPIHNDHDYPHKQLLLYLNDPLDKESKTVVLDDDKKTILKEITPERFKAVCFDNKPHYHYYPKMGERIVAVYTFR
jgi:hypothetical protein